MTPYELLYQIALFAVTMAAAAVVAKIFSLIVGGMFRTWAPRVRAEFQKIVSITIWVIGLLFAIQQLGLRADFLLLLIGLFGVIVVIAIRDSLENIGAKYFSDVYVPFKLGDVVQVGNTSGKVIEINPITTVLLTGDSKLVSVPNSLFLREKVINKTQYAWEEIMIPITLSSAVDLPKFESEALKSCNRMRRYLDERFPPIMTVKRRDKRSAELVLTIMIKDPSKRHEITEELNQKISEIEDKMRRRK